VTTATETSAAVNDATTIDRNGIATAPDELSDFP
jgi:hypothetical protein